MSEAHMIAGHQMHGEGHSAELVEQSPFALPSKKLAIWLFIIADAATFAAMLVAYGFIRNADPNWPRPFHSIANVAPMTLILLTSSLTMLFGVQAAYAGNKKAAIRWVLFTALLAAIFALLHIREWFGLIGEGLTLSKNPWGGSQLFGATFYGVTGLHLLHVIGGFFVLLFVTQRYNSGRYDANHIETAGLYWHFVDLVWMFVVPLVYLLNFSR
ncbi:MAG: cytochrome c oxidase subunit 3 [Candidatus Sulfotelmatobacter sp.]